MNFKEYHPDWSDRIRPDILRRDNYKCQECGIAHKSYYLFEKGRLPIKIEQDEFVEYKSIGLDARIIYLQVAHMDCNKANNNYDNLRSLCPTCHLRYDKHHKKLMRIAKKKDSNIYGSKQA